MVSMMNTRLLVPLADCLMRSQHTHRDAKLLVGRARLAQLQQTLKGLKRQRLERTRPFRLFPCGSGFPLAKETRGRQREQRDGDEEGGGKETRTRQRWDGGQRTDEG
ncbi:hypothetical protein EYF80_026237 [Liparis tanakae]|uniref:Uncharacterized protein n=1 Tax=Liparis tanakae TaxID=230148 RepID=A0A4Z2HE78_9TELE|nr:hypothetical protein EYF80_026237 [Liparis tanakae]